MKRARRIRKVALGLVLLAAVLYFVRLELKVSGEFKILPVQHSEVRTEVEGLIESVLKDEGDTVGPGDLIAVLSDRDYSTDLRQTTAEIEEKSARLKMLKAGARPEEIELARTAVTKARERLDYARTYLEMEKTLFEGNLSPRKDYELAKEQLGLRAKELEEAEGNLKLLLAGSRAEVIEAAQAEINRLLVHQRYLDEQLRRLKIVSPITGIITTHKLKERAGQNVRKGDLIADVHELRNVTAEISVSEKEISDVKLGQPVLLKARAHSQTRFAGRVISIAPIATKPADGFGDRTFLVTTELGNADLLLKPEMTGNAKIVCGKRRLYEIMSRRFVRFIRVEFWSWW